jgi:hypothetical protein
MYILIHSYKKNFVSVEDNVHDIYKQMTDVHVNHTFPLASLATVALDW